MLSVRGDKILDENGNPFRLRGVNIGGWMNMENFLDGYPGNETGIRAAMTQVLGPEKGQFFYDRLLDYFFTEDDVAAIKFIGATVIRLPLNYRHFESDESPFEYFQKGFERLDQALGWCEKYEIRAILDLHAVQGWQNCYWHSDNASPHSLFWYDRGYQDRFVALWKEIARRYSGNPTVAGYDPICEPATVPSLTALARKQEVDFGLIQSIYRRVTAAIREVDPEHIIFPEGDFYGIRFDGLDAPFAENVVWSSHHYCPPCWGLEPYPGKHGDDLWNAEWVQNDVKNHQGVVYAAKYNTPLYVGEFGGGFSHDELRTATSLKAIDDQLRTFEELGLHWTMWGWKGIDKMAIYAVDETSPYIRTAKPVLDAESALTAGFDSLCEETTLECIRTLSDLMIQAIRDPDLGSRSNCSYLAMAALKGYAASLMQVTYAKQFKHLSMDELDGMLQSFKIQNCRPRKGVLEMLKKYMALPA